ncbi:MAG: tRNA (N6-isopentenyl adenosine(37)-C2)-methylthiotransferase MiaB [Bacteroidetes bacterium]|nr:MAG: tRNA (N6-isopentenyl adenosine(37)-C2)-methylthiotransferase MiaB [Bacteroidota bacterium]
MFEKEIDENRQGEVLYTESGRDQRPNKKLYLESYGCAMNFSDSEIVASIMQDEGFSTTRNQDEADVIFLNTCAIRENAEQRIWTRLYDFKKAKQKKPGLIIGVLGCMAERLKTELLEKQKLVDIVVGPDAYRDLPGLLEKAGAGNKAINVLLSREETYAEISPVRLDENGISSFISIMRGCDNMCSFCVVPFTRGRERSRDPLSIVNEAKELFENGYKEVTLLGQNVDSYLWHGGGPKKDLDQEIVKAALRRELPPKQQKEFITFADLLEMVAGVHPDLRIRFSTSNPQDMTDDVLHVVARHENICKYIHLPVQSGNNRILEKMNRGYTREIYMERIRAIRNIIPDCGLSSDIIAGFCSETEDEHQDTLSIMQWSGFDFSYMFSYSERPGTLAAKRFPDDVPENLTSRRLSEIIEVQKKLSHESNKKDLNKVHRVLVESISKKSDEYLSGRNTQNKVVVFPRENFKPGQYVDVLVHECTPATLIGKAVKGK